MSLVSEVELISRLDTEVSDIHPLTFDWEDLRYFITFCKIRSLNGAAKKLGVEHATVSRRIASLEKSLSIKLVDRRKRSYELTDEGLRLATIGQRMAREADAVGRMAVAVQAQMARQVTISAPGALAAEKLIPHLWRFRALYPQMLLRLLGDNGYKVLADCQADLCLRYGRPDLDSIVARRVGSVTFAFYASVSYLQGRSALDYEFIAYDDALDSPEQQRWLDNVVGARPIVLKAKTLEVQLKAVQAGVGVALLPCFAVDPLAQLSRLALAPPLAVDVWLAVHEDLRAVPCIQAAMGYIESCFG